MFADKAGAYPNEALYRLGFWALPTNIRLGWKGLPGTLAYYENSSLTAVKKFYNIGHST
jgi:hypothetical protein